MITTTDAEHRNVFLTDAGLDRVEAALRSGSLYDDANRDLLTAVHCALHAEALLRRDVDYIVRDGGVEIVDEFTGRVVDGRHWPDGLQAAVEAKEGDLPERRGTHPRLDRPPAVLRPLPAPVRDDGDGALGGARARGILRPRGRRRPVRMSRASGRTSPTPSSRTAAAKRDALVREIGAAHAAGRPVLVGTASVRESEGAGRRSSRRPASPARSSTRRTTSSKRGSIARAGARGAVTISTNMAGRGTDIRLGGPDERDRAAVAALGGLYVIGTNRHESLRIDRQLRGRAGRQGDPGSSRFFISFEDDIFVRYGLDGDAAEKVRPGASERARRRPSPSGTRSLTPSASSKARTSTSGAL